MPCPYTRGVGIEIAIVGGVARIGNNRRASALRYIWCVVAVGGCKKTRLHRSNHVVVCEAH
jgi:hypothetical protein